MYFVKKCLILKNYSKVNQQGAGQQVRVLSKISFLLILILFSIINMTKVSASYIAAECLSGECSLGLQLNDNDLSKVFPESYPGYRIRLNTEPLLVQGSQSEHFKILVYTKNSSSSEVISTHSIAISPKAAKRKNVVLILDIPQFLGTKIFWMDIYKTNGSLSSTYRVTLNGYGTLSANKQAGSAAIYGQSLSSLISPQLGVSFPNSVLNSTSCPDNKFNDCNLQELFFHKFSVESSTVQDPNKTSVLKETDGTIKLRIPVVASRKSRQERLSSSLRDTFIGADNPNVVQDPNLVNNQPVTLTQVDELNLGSSSLTNFAIDEVNNELELTVSNSALPLVLRSNTVSFNGKEPKATLDLDTDEIGTTPSMRFSSSPLITPVRNGSFEFDNNNLYFTANGQREFIMQSTAAQFSQAANVANVKALLAANADTLQSKDSLFFQNASNFDTGTINASLLPPNLQIERLFNENINNSLTMKGGHNVTLTSQADALLSLPLTPTGTLATLADLAVLLGPNTVSTTHILDENLLAEDFSNQAITDSKILSLDASDITTGIISPARLPNQEISNVNNLSVSLADKIESTDVVNDLLSFSTDKTLSANQGIILKNQIDALPQNFDTVNQNLTTNVIDFTKYHSVFKKTVGPATNFTATNLVQGHKAYLVLQGDTPSFPSYFNLIEGSYNQDTVNVVSLEVLNSTPANQRVNMKIFNYPLVNLVLSVRKVNPAYNGPCMRVRRSNDNAEQDIYFTNAGNLDTASLQLFTGSNNAFVTKWYDQSLNAYDVEQNNNLLQPQIVSGGSILLSDNGLPAINFVDDFLQNSNVQLTPSFSSLTVAATTSLIQDENNNYIFNQGSFANGKIKGLFFEDDSDIAAANGFSSQTVVPSSLLLNNSYLFSYVYNESDQKSRIFIDSTLKNTANLPSSGTPDNQPLVIGRNSSINNGYASMTVQEIRIYNRVLTDLSRQSIEANINSYFNLF